jgi:hypothetical protein
MSKLETSIKADIAQELSKGFHENRQDMMDLNRKFSFLCQKLGYNDTNHEQKTPSSKNQTVTHPIADAMADVPMETIVDEILVDTPERPVIRKPT